MISKTTTTNIFQFLRLTGFIFLIITFACKSNDRNDSESSEQDSFEAQEYSQPKSEITYSDRLENRLYDRLFFIGWSKDGKVAYIKEPADEATGFYFFTLIIKDVENGQELFEWVIDEKDEQHKGDLKQTWENNLELFSRELNKHKIYPNEADIRAFPVNIDGRHYSLDHNISYEKHEYFPFDVVSRAEIVLLSEQQNAQMIFSKDYEADLKLGVKATHCILSPYSKHALLAVAQEQRGYEGPPHLIRLQVSGFKFPEN